MVDWAWVDRKRAAGKSWEEIASDPRSGFQPDPKGTTPGRQLRALARDRDPAGAAPREEDRTSRRWGLARVGWLLFPLLAPWVFLALVLPSPVGVYLPAIPFLGLAAAAAGILLAIGLLRSPRKWTPAFRQTATAGVTVGLLLAGALGGAALASGCPVLSPFLTGEPGGWERVAQGSFRENGIPVLFFYGSVACPYCSASSWAVLAALQSLGQVSGVTYDHSSSTDVYPNTPSVVLPDLSVASSYVVLDARESTGDAQIVAPAVGACIEQAYLSAYNPLGAIPFVVVGPFVHAQATLVDPAALSGLTAAQVSSQLAQKSGTAYLAITSAEAYLLAYLVYQNGGAPANVASEPAVAAIVAQIR